MIGQTFDFRKPLPSSLESKVNSWLTEAAKNRSRIWSKYFEVESTLILESVHSMSTAAAFQEVPVNPVAFRLKSQDANDFHPLLILSRPVVIGLIAASLGTILDEMPEDRSLSELEESLCDLVIQKLFLELVQSAWPSTNPLKLSVDAHGEPLSTNLMEMTELVLVARWLLELPFGKTTVLFIIPRSGPVAGLARPTTSFVPQPDREHIESLVKEMRVDVTVLLGSASVSMLQLASLKPGDVLVLNQKVADPLSAKIAGVDKLQVWPGAVGRRQAVQVEDTIK
ncbi:MAG: FliM/FliN family flagellar motor switch protein [Gemmataceae bacterium]|jgi:flagellar motor switch protein FliM|nr:FliM/FliN family flagellar motor switch protein [Gemmataceae bacterium]